MCTQSLHRSGDPQGLPLSGAPASPDLSLPCSGSLSDHLSFLPSSSPLMPPSLPRPLQSRGSLGLTLESSLLPVLQGPEAWGCGGQIQAKGAEPSTACEEESQGTWGRCERPLLLQGG